MNKTITIAQIDQLLPQVQCEQCGYKGCLPYATAITQGEAINRCPPGDQAGVEALAQLLGIAAMALDTSRGQPQAPRAAVIEEAACIGCTLCIQVCPTDAIVGAAKQMHTVITVDCTGCDLCVPVCPTDCIRMVPAAAMGEKERERSRRKTQARRERLARYESEHKARLAAKLQQKLQQKAPELLSQQAQQTLLEKLNTGH